MVNLKKVRETILNHNQNIKPHILHYAETSSCQKLSYCIPGYWYGKTVTIICNNDNNVSFVCEKYGTENTWEACTEGYVNDEDTLIATQETRLVNYIKNNKKFRSILIDKEPGRVKTFLTLDDRDKHKELMVTSEWERLVFACKHYWPDLRRSEAIAC